MDLTEALAAREKADKSEGSERRYRQAARDYLRDNAGDDPAAMAEELAGRWDGPSAEQAPTMADEYRQVRALLTGEGVGPMPAGDATVTSGPRARKAKDDDE